MACLLGVSLKLLHFINIYANGLATLLKYEPNKIASEIFDNKVYKVVGNLEKFFMKIFKIY